MIKNVINWVNLLKRNISFNAKSTFLAFGNWDIKRFETFAFRYADRKCNNFNNKKL